MRRDDAAPDAPLGTFEEQVLLSVIHAGADGFGMNVRREIEQRTGREVAIGAVYATLDRLEAKGLIASSRATGPARRLFQVTWKGAQMLVETRTMRDHLWQGITLQKLAAFRRA